MKNKTYKEFSDYANTAIAHQILSIKMTSITVLLFNRSNSIVVESWMEESGSNIFELIKSRTIDLNQVVSANALSESSTNSA